VNERDQPPNGNWKVQNTLGRMEFGKVHPLNGQESLKPAQERKRESFVILPSPLSPLPSPVNPSYLIFRPS